MKRNTLISTLASINLLAFGIPFCYGVYLMANDQTINLEATICEGSMLVSFLILLINFLIIGKFDYDKEQKRKLEHGTTENNL